MHRLILGMALLAVMPGHGQATGPDSQPAALDATHLPAGVLDLGPGWRTHAGDNLGWAQPGFDDNGWTAANLDRLGPAQPGWRWFRLDVHLGPDHPPLHLLLQGGQGIYEIFLNGQRAPCAILRPLFGATHPTEQVFALPNSSEVEIALRTHALYMYSGLHERLFVSASLGPPQAIETKRAALQSQRLYTVFPSIAINLLLVLAGLGAFALWGSQHGHAEYLWLALYLIALGASNFLTFTQANGLGPEAWGIVYGDPLIYAFTVMQIQFTFAFAGRRVGRAWRAYEVLLVAMIVPSQLTTFAGFPSTLYVVLEALALLPASILLPVLLLLWYRRGNREAGWLILPSLFPAASWVISNLGVASVYAGWGHADFLANPSVSVGVTHLQAPGLGDLLFLLAIGVVIFFRFTRVNREQARAAAELEAAQRVQALLLRSVQSSAAPIHLATAYKPAQEVGGDFFHVARIEDRTRIVIGDVSGKGLGAAMLVSALIGALDSISSAEGVEVLRGLNNLLLDRQQGGFATCLVAVVHGSGSLALSNAGHLPPWHNGQEIELEGSLPLGMKATLDPAALTLNLQPGDTLTFLSDGVVEAQNATGELFGFERARAISTQSAQSIAAAAQAYGQSDDITVLTLTFSPAEVMHA
ncbi:MAG: PP2C family protein-serine/threonine phosphatase [Acidobacteriaceae bacterium]